MSGMCGWLGGGSDPLAAQQRINGMICGIGGEADPSLRFTYDAAGGLAVFSRFDQASFHEEGGIKAALAGPVYWDDEELARIAHQRNPAAAAAKAYLRDGRDLLRRLHGPFSLAIVDGNGDSVLIAIDRLGVHSLCYAHQAGAFAFASHADGVVAHPAVNGELDPQAIFNYLFFHMVPSPGTIYRDVWKLLPGEYVMLRRGALERGFYWKLHYRDAGHEAFDPLAQRFKQLLRTSVRRAASDIHTGAFLSGGTDSSTVSGVLTEVLGKPADTFSIGFAAEGYDEMEYARVAVKHFGTRAHEYYVTPQDVMDAIPLIAKAYDEPFGNASAIPVYYCAKMARESGARLMLAGDGGDEIFGGNARYAKQKIFEPYQLIPGALRRGLIEPVVFRLPGGERLPPLRKLRSYINQARIPLPDRLESYNFLYRVPLDEVFTADYLAQIDSHQSEEIMREVYGRTDSASFINRMLHLDLKLTLADNDLRKVNRMCELAGVAVHYPLLDEEMVEFSAQLPASFKVKGLKLRYFFKEALKDFLPPETLSKSKHGFGLPFGLWMQSHAPLRELAYDSLKSFARRGYVKPKYLERLIEQHRSGDASYHGVMIWVIMMLEQWLAARKL